MDEIKSDCVNYLPINTLLTDEILIVSDKKSTSRYPKVDSYLNMY